MENSHSRAAVSEMLIRRPVAEVFEAFINPEITTKFWFTKSTGKLEEGKTVEWIWEMYNVSSQVLVKAIEFNKQILIEWGNNGQTTTVEWTFTEFNDGATFASIVNTGFQGDVDELITKIRDSTEGFTWVLAGLKAYLEHNIELNAIVDRFPKSE